MKRHFDSATCPNCQTFYDRLPVDGDEDGNCWLVLESKPCATCGQMLCPNCEQFVCEHGETHCLTHLTMVADGTPRGLLACPVCLEEIAESDASELPPVGVCMECEQLVEATAASVQRGGDVWHTSCYNAMTEYYRQQAEEYEDSEGFRHLEDAAFPARREPVTAPAIAAKATA